MMPLSAGLTRMPEDDIRSRSKEVWGLNLLVGLKLLEARLGPA